MSGMVASQYHLMRAFQAALDVTSGVPDAITQAKADILDETGIELTDPSFTYAGADEISLTDANDTPAVFWTLKGAAEAEQYATGGRIFDSAMKVDVVTHFMTITPDAKNNPPSQTDMACLTVLYMDMIRRALFSPDGIPSAPGCSIANIEVLDLSLQDYFVDGFDNEYGHQMTMFIGVSNEDEGYNG